MDLSRTGMIAWVEGRKAGGESYSSIAKSLGCSTAVLYSLRKGKNTPSGEAAVTKAMKQEAAQAQATEEVSEEPAPAVAPTTHERPKRHGWLYVMWDPAIPDRVKIGRCADCKSRLATHRTTAPDAQFVYTVFVFGDCAAAESKAKKSLVGKHYKLEHFTVSRERAYKAILEAANHFTVVNDG
jgi:hypothetical protein